MILPFLISVPHAGLRVPPEVEALCILKEQDIIEDNDVGASEIFFPLRDEVEAFVTTDIARAIVDVNRKEDDRRKDGVIKTHTCWNVPVYREAPSEELVSLLIKKYHRPYHVKLSQITSNILLGMDCHTMAAEGPPIGPDPHAIRPRVCLSNGDGTCPREWIELLAACFIAVFDSKVTINTPFRGGYIVRSHSKEIPWIQVELSRESFIDDKEKRVRFLAVIKEWGKKGKQLF